MIFTAYQPICGLFIAETLALWILELICMSGYFAVTNFWEHQWFFPDTSSTINPWLGGGDVFIPFSRVFALKWMNEPD